MVGVPSTGSPGPGDALVRQLAPGGIMLTGRSRDGTAGTAARVAALRRAAPDGPSLLVATDQEGGQVQVLSGPGFTAIPAATDQERRPDRLRADTSAWGAELAAAGVDVDLAPVADVLRPSLGRRNLAVGASGRTYGTDPVAVRTSVLAVLAGLRDAGVAATVKHFPGLGAVAANTDTTAGVEDETLTPSAAALEPFRAAVSARVPLVMVSSASYSRIDPGTPAVFSRPVISGLLRGGLGFTGVAVSDDLGRARAVAAVAPGERAVRFVAAGGDLVLTVDPAIAASMIDALARRAASDPAFAATLAASARRVLELKERLGLLRC